VGDAVLIEIAWRMKSTAADKGALVCRYGGEEFAILLPDTDRRAAAQMAENVRRAIADSPVTVRNAGPAPSVPVTVSLGVAVYEPGGASRLTTPELLVQAADKSLYAAKGAGRNCVRIFSERSSGAIAA
jgi:diguanylate cyclase (GGDEF)-like protein